MSSDFAKSWLDDDALARKRERVDVVADELERSPGAFDDPDLRRFIADHIVEIDAAAKGRWRRAMDLLSGWLHPELGHLIVVAGARVLRAGLASPDELRAWIRARRSHGWVDDSWVVPLEGIIEEHAPKPFAWPAFETPRPLDGGRSWTATFDSYDQHHEVCHYLVRIFEGEHRVGELMAEVGLEFAGDDWTAPGFLPELTERIARAAAATRSVAGSVA
ncbi:MAG: hypothetical protein KIT84_05110 [Labilithrix sp.]|nr:hypothetical protein [Labilithrix sp.]MCW5810366.1 hypothetical protein [Labilithrix sp.]